MARVRMAAMAAICGLALLCGAAGAARASGAEAERQFTFAARLMQQGEAQLAEEAFGDFVRRFPGDGRVSDAHYYLALLTRQRGDRAGAAAHLGRVKQPLHISAEAVNLLRGQVKLETGDAAGAVADLEKVQPGKLPDSESRAAWAYLLGAGYRAAGNLPAAARHFDVASEADSAVRGMALLELGKARIEMKEGAAAIEALTAAAGSNLDSQRAAEARSLAGALAYEQGSFERAAELYRQVVQNHQATTYFQPALIGFLRSLYASGQDAELVRQHEAVRQLLPVEHQGEALYLSGASLVRLGQHKEASAPLLEFYRRFGGDHPLANEVAYLYAVCFYHTDLPGFEKWFESLEGDMGGLEYRHDLRYLRAQAAVKQDKPAEAIRYLGLLIEDGENPYARRALLQRAALLEQVGQVEEAGADYARYAQEYGQDPRATDAARRAIDLAFGSGQMGQVVELAEAWLKQEGLEPGEAAAVRFRLAVALIKLERHDASLVHLQRILDGSPDDRLRAMTHLYRGLVLAARAQRATGGAGGTVLEATEPAVEELGMALRGPLAEEQQVEAVRIIAQLHRLAGRDEAALESYERLRRRGAIGEIDASTAVWVGRLLHERGQHEAALAWLSWVGERRDAGAGAVAEALFLAARSQQAMGQWEAAVDGYRRLLASGRGYGEQGRLGLAQSLAGAGQAEEAMDEYNGLLSAASSEVAASALLDSALLQRDLAERFARAGDQARAQSHLEECRRRLSRVTILYDLPQLGDTAVRAQFVLAQVTGEMGETEKARQYYQQIIGRSEAGAWQQAARAEVMLLGGQRGDAVYLLRRMIEQGADGRVTGYARQRLGQLGETP